MMRCNICGWANPQNLGQFRPFTDVDWDFEIYQCSQCGVRFALRDSNINYHEVLHSSAGSSYSYHYRMAEEVKKMLALGDVDKCERYVSEVGYKYRQVIRFVKERQKTDELLEIGCSTGFLTALLNASGYKVEGIDISESAVRYAQDTFGPFYSTHAQKKSYDVIYHLGLIGCVDNPKEFLLNYLKLLKPSGTMIFNAPNVESVIQLAELWVDTPPPDLIYLFSEGSFKKMIDPPLNLEIQKIYTKEDTVRKGIKKLMGKNFYHYPVRFLDVDSGVVHRRANMKRYLTKLFWFTCGLLYHLNVYRKYDADYGLFVLIKNGSEVNKTRNQV